MNSNINKIKNEITQLILFFKEFENFSSSRNSNHLGLFSGLTGLLAVLLDCHIQNPSLVSKNKIKEYFLQSLKLIEENETLMSTYCDGLAGYGFFLLKIKESKVFNEEAEILEEIDDLLNQIDEILDEHIIINILEDNHDILHGIIGLGLYFLERNKLENVDRIIDFLISGSKSIGEQIYWTKYDKYKTYKTVIDLGLAHGNASILYFFTKVLKNTKNEHHVKSLIPRLINFYLENIQELNEEIFTIYPTLIVASEYIDKTYKPENSRLAWCYGDLGILHTLLVVSNQMNDLDCFNKVTSMLEVVAKRKIENEFFFIDLGFCHGSSGIAVIFKNIYQITKNEIFNEASNYWIELTLKSKNITSKNYIGYDFPITDSDEQNYSLLEGLSGLLFCYLSFDLNEMPITKELLFLKI